MRQPRPHKPATQAELTETRAMFQGQNRAARAANAASLERVRAPETEEEAARVILLEIYEYLPVMGLEQAFLGEVSALTLSAHDEDKALIKRLDAEEIQRIYGRYIALTAWWLAMEEAYKYVLARLVAGKPLTAPALEIWRMMYAEYKPGERGGRRAPRALLREHQKALLQYRVFNGLTRLFGEQAAHDALTGALAATVSLAPGNAPGQGSHDRTAAPDGEKRADNQTERLAHGLRLEAGTATALDGLFTLLPGIIATQEPGETEFEEFRRIGAQVRRDVNGLALPAKKAPLPEKEAGGPDPALHAFERNEFLHGVTRALYSVASENERRMLEELRADPELADHGNAAAWAGARGQSVNALYQAKNRLKNKGEKIIKKEGGDP